LPFEVVIVDEASMVDLALMSRLLVATPPDARVILLGDKDQLASVEAGAVLGDICRAGEAGASADENHPVRGRRRAPRPPALAECIVHLRRIYRFGADNGILALSQAINAGDADLALALVTAGEQKREGLEGVALPPPERLK